MAVQICKLSIKADRYYWREKKDVYGGQREEHIVAMNLTFILYF